MANTERGRYRMRDWEQDDTQPNRNALYERDFDELQRQNFSRSSERDRMRSKRGFRASDDRERSSNDYDENGYLPSDAPMKASR